MNENEDTAPAAPLHPALWDGDLPRVRQLLDEGADPNARDPNGWPALSRAIERRQPEIALLLIERGADCRATDKRRRTPLHWAAQYGTDAVAECLLEQGAETSAWDSASNTPLSQASRHGRTTIVRMLLHGQWSSVIRDYRWRESFFLALHHRHPDTVAAFLDEGLNVDSTTHRLFPRETRQLPYQSTALMEAITTRDPRIVALLLHRGADVAKTFDRHSALTEALTYYGKEATLTRTLLDRGVALGLEEAIVANDLTLAEQWLMSNTVSEAPDDYGQTLLTWAARRGQADAVRLLVRFGAKANPDIRSSNWATPLSNAAATGDIAQMEFLIAHGANPDVDRSSRQAIPLASAAAADRVEAMRWLIDRFGMTVEQGVEALNAAAASNRFEAARFLLNLGVDVNTRSTSYGRSPLMNVAWRGDVELARLLLEHGADASYSEGRSNSVISFAARAGRKHVIPLLVAHGVPQEEKNSALFEALHGEHSDTAELLLQGGADPNATLSSHYQTTPLMLASKWGKVSTVQMLLGKGAAIDAVDREGKTALDYAEKAGRADIAALLA